MTNFERYITENADCPAVVSLLAISNRMTLNGRFGEAFAKVCKLADEAYGPRPSLEQSRRHVAGI